MTTNILRFIGTWTLWTILISILLSFVAFGGRGIFAISSIIAILFTLQSEIIYELRKNKEKNHKCCKEKPTEHHSGKCQLNN